MNDKQLKTEQLDTEQFNMIIDHDGDDITFITLSAFEFMMMLEYGKRKNTVPFLHLIDLVEKAQEELDEKCEG